MTAPPWQTDDGSPWIVAEIGANHNGDVAVARELIEPAASWGAARLLSPPGHLRTTSLNGQRRVQG